MTVEKRFENYLDRIVKRRNHLADRIKATDKHLSYDEAELAALDWVIVLLSDKQDVALDHLELYLKETR